MLISREYGSYTFLSELFLNVELEPDLPHKNFCGTCTNCLKSCPTDAFEQPYVLDAKKCISYITIEKRDELNSAEEQKLGKNLYGCDICQEVCPWNRFAKLTQDPNFIARESLLKKPIHFWANMTLEEYTTLFKKSAAKRTKYQGLIRNINAIKKHGAS
jgi:epoxyqueuosine reductase